MVGLSPNWLQLLQQHVLSSPRVSDAQRESFEVDWEREQFAKGTVGAMVDAATVASHAGESIGLRARVYVSFD